MPQQPDNSKQPPVQQHRSSDAPPHGSDMGDDPRQAAESGEQSETSRSRGQVIDESGAAAGDTPQKGQGDKGEHWESGRHKA